MNRWLKLSIIVAIILVIGGGLIWWVYSVFAPASEPAMVVTGSKTIKIDTKLLKGDKYKSLNVGYDLPTVDMEKEVGRTDPFQPF
jgi:hypothetical protein